MDFLGKHSYDLSFHMLVKCCGINIEQFWIWLLHFMTETPHIFNMENSMFNVLFHLEIASIWTKKGRHFGHKEKILRTLNGSKSLLRPILFPVPIDLFIYFRRLSLWFLYFIYWNWGYSLKKRFLKEANCKGGSQIISTPL